MNTPAPLELRDIHLPDPISWWPPAPGWWLLLLLPILIYIGWWSVHRWSRRHRLKKNALIELDQLKQAYTNDPNVQRCASELSALLRRIALVRYPRHQVAALTGEAWLEFLDQNTDASSPFTQGAGRLLITAPFQPHTTTPLDELFMVCQHWIEALPSDNQDFQTRKKNATIQH